MEWEELIHSLPLATRGSLLYSKLLGVVHWVRLIGRLGEVGIQLPKDLLTKVGWGDSDFDFLTILGGRDVLLGCSASVVGTPREIRLFSITIESPHCSEFYGKVVSRVVYQSTLFLLSWC